MEDIDRTKEQLINELIKLRKKIAKLESAKISHKLAEKQLVKSEELYRLIAENTSDVITLHDFNLQATFTYISPSIKISGYEPEELLGKSPFEFIHPDDSKKLFLRLKSYVNLPSTTSQEAHRICERIRKICEEDSIKPIYLRPSISLGHATQKGEYQNAEALLKEADKRMYQDKLFRAKSREKYLLDSF